MCYTMQQMKKRPAVTRIMVNLTASQVTSVRGLAMRDGRTLSAWVRQLVLAELQKGSVVK